MAKLLPSEKIERQVLIKREEEGVFGKKPEERTVEELLDYGLINVDKPKGPTSHQVSAFVQKILKIKKSGHSGTLDPAVTGCLPVALGKGTRAIQLLTNAGKEYVALMHLHDEFSSKEVKTIFKRMTGNIKQLPPVKCAIKRQWRYRKVYYIQIIEMDHQDILFRIGCEAGTYIRKYIHDFGQFLDSGAHMQQLRRTKVGHIHEDSLVTLQDLSDAYHYFKEGDDSKIKKILMPIERALKHIPKIWISDNCIPSILNGVDLKIPGISRLNEGIEPDQQVAIMSLNDELIALGTAKIASNKMMKEDKGLAVNINNVLYYKR